MTDGRFRVTGGNARTCDIGMKAIRVDDLVSDAGYDAETEISVPV